MWNCLLDLRSEGFDCIIPRMIDHLESNPQHLEEYNRAIAERLWLLAGSSILGNYLRHASIPNYRIQIEVAEIRSDLDELKALTLSDETELPDWFQLPLVHLEVNLPYDASLSYTNPDTEEKEERGIESTDSDYFFNLSGQALKLRVANEYIIDEPDGDDENKSGIIPELLSGPDINTVTLLPSNQSGFFQLTARDYAKVGGVIGQIEGGEFLNILER